MILVEPEAHLAEHLIVPDIAGWRRERLSAIPDSAIDVVPDWVCEILLSSTAGEDRKLKLPIYAALGVGYARVVDPTARTFEVLRRTDANWMRIATWGDQDPMRAEPFDAVAIELAPLWPW